VAQLSAFFLGGVNDKRKRVALYTQWSCLQLSLPLRSPVYIFHFVDLLLDCMDAACPSLCLFGLILPCLLSLLARAASVPFSLLLLSLTDLLLTFHFMYVSIIDAHQSLPC